MVTTFRVIQDPLPEETTPRFPIIFVPYQPLLEKDLPSLPKDSSFALPRARVTRQWNKFPRLVSRQA